MTYRLTLSPEAAAADVEARQGVDSLLSRRSTACTRRTRPPDGSEKRDVRARRRSLILIGFFRIFGAA